MRTSKCACLIFGVTLARNEQEEFLMGQVQDHTCHITDNTWMASSFQFLFICPSFPELLLAILDLSKATLENCHAGLYRLDVTKISKKALTAEHGRFNQYVNDFQK